MGFFLVSFVVEDFEGWLLGFLCVLGVFSFGGCGEREYSLNDEGNFLKWKRYIVGSFLFFGGFWCLL